ncbi:MAG: hypothetical protein ACRCZ9_05740 [Fusobacteriaceae bacterium]
MKREPIFLDKKSKIIFCWQALTNSYEPISIEAEYNEETREWDSQEIKKGDIFYDFIMFIRHSSRSICKVTGETRYGNLEIYQWAIAFKIIQAASALKSEDILCAISRQAGKSYLARKLSGFIPIFLPKHVKIPEDRFYTIFIAVKKDLLADQCGKLMPEIESAFDFFNLRYPRTPLIKGVPWKSTKLIIDMDLNSKQVPYASFDGISANAPVNAGFTSHFMICDESQEIEFEKFNEQIKPFSTRTGGILCAIGTTTSNPDNVLFDMYVDQSLPEYRKILYTWEDVYKYKNLNNESGAEKYKRRVEQEINKYGKFSDYVQSQYYVSFNIVGTKFITIDRLRNNGVFKLVGGKEKIENNRDNFIVGGFDLAVANDYAVISTGESTYELDSYGNVAETSIKTNLRDVLILNPDRTRIGIDELIDEVANVCKKRSIDMLMVDATAGQEHASLFLIKKLKELEIDTMVIPFSFANKNKVSMMTYFENSLFNQTIALPLEDYREEDEHYGEFLDELCYLQKTRNTSGTLQFKAPNGESFFDDCVMSVAMMNYCLHYASINDGEKLIDLSSEVKYYLSPHKMNAKKKLKKISNRIGRY